MNYNGIQFTRKGMKNNKRIGQGKGETFCKHTRWVSYIII